MAQRPVEAVDLALMLAVDVSSSVDSGDFKLQMDGIAAAVRNPALLDAIRQGRHQRIALSLVQWSRRDSQKISVPWRLLQSAANMEAFARAVENAERDWLPGGTAMAAAIQFCAAELLLANLNAARRVIDVSGDGEDNEQGNVRAARDAAVSQGITINGLPILSGSQLLLPYYTSEVAGGDGSFVLPATNILAFRQAMMEKLLREVAARSV